MTKIQFDNLPAILPADPPPIAATTGAIADFQAVFYGLFVDIRPLGPRDAAYFEGLIEDFAHEVDIFEELKKFQAWSLDKGLEAIPYPRSRFRNWLMKAREFKRHTHTSERSARR